MGKERKTTRKQTGTIGKEKNNRQDTGMTRKKNREKGKENDRNTTGKERKKTAKETK